MGLLSNTGLLAVPTDKHKSEPKRNEPKLTPHLQCEVTSAPFMLRPYAGIYNPFPNRCSVLCNHPTNTEAKEFVKRAKDAWSLEGKLQYLNEDLSKFSEGQDKEKIKTPHDIVTEDMFRRYTETDSRPLTPAPTLASGKSRGSRRCLTPDEPHTRTAIVLDLRRSHSQETLYYHGYTTSEMTGGQTTSATNDRSTLPSVAISEATHTRLLKGQPEQLPPLALPLVLARRAERPAKEPTSVRTDRTARKLTRTCKSQLTRTCKSQLTRTCKSQFTRTCKSQCSASSRGSWSPLPGPPSTPTLHNPVSILKNCASSDCTKLTRTCKSQLTRTCKSQLTRTCKSQFTRTCKSQCSASSRGSWSPLPGPPSTPTLHNPVSILKNCASSDCTKLSQFGNPQRVHFSLESVRTQSEDDDTPFCSPTVTPPTYRPPAYISTIKRPFPFSPLQKTTSKNQVKALNLNKQTKGKSKAAGDTPASQRSKADKETADGSENEIDNDDGGSGERRRGKRKRKGLKGSDRLTSAGLAAQTQQDPETQIAGIGTDSHNPSSRGSIAPLADEDSIILPIIKPPTVNLRKTDSFLDDDILKFLHREVDEEVIETEFDTKRRYVFEEAWRTRPDRPLGQEMQALLKELKVPAASLGEWLHIPRVFSRQNAQFALPIDTNALENLSPMQYAARFVTLKKSKQLLYLTVIRKFRPQGFRMPIKDIEEGLVLMMGGMITMDKAIQFKSIMEWDTYAEEENIPDEIKLTLSGTGIQRQSVDIGDIGENEVSTTLKYRTWCGLCAICERVYGRFQSRDQDPPDGMELSDFTMLETKLAMLKVHRGLIEILNAIRTR